MINGHTTFGLAPEIDRVINLGGNSGRTVRRLAKRLVGEKVGGSYLIIQELCGNEKFCTAVQSDDLLFNRVEAYAHNYLRYKMDMFLPEEKPLEALGIFSDKYLGLVFFSYKVTIDIETASIAELRSLLHCIAILADLVQPMEFIPEDTLAKLQALGY